MKNSLRTIIIAFFLFAIGSMGYAQLAKPGSANARYGIAHKQQRNPISSRRPTKPFTVQRHSPGITSSPWRSLNFSLPQVKPVLGYRLEGYGEDPSTRMPIFIETSGHIEVRSSLNSLEAVAATAASYLKDVQSLLPLQAADKEFVVKGFTGDDLGHVHVKMNQYHLNVPVYGAEIVLHFQPQGRRVLNGRFTLTPRKNDARPNLSPEAAIAVAESDQSGKTRTAVAGDLVKYDHSKAELVWYPREQGNVVTHTLAYDISFHSDLIHHWQYFVDAKTGEIIHKYDQTCSFMPPRTALGRDLNNKNQTVNTFQLDASTYIMLDASKPMFKGNFNGTPKLGDGFIITFDVGNDINKDQYPPVSTTNNSGWSPTAISAHVNSSICYDYYLNTHKRNSIDGNGGDVRSFINVPDEENKPMDNAYWNGVAMFYGNGDFAFKPLAGGLDVAAHEMTHGVIQETANLVYENEPGALNESFADVFAVLIENEDFKLGEDVVKTNVFRSGALRDVLNPNNGGRSLNDNGYQPASVSEQYRGTEDNGGVHINSGITNRAFALFYQAVGREKAEQVYYRALDKYLTRSSKFTDCRLAVIQATKDLYGAADAEKAATAFTTVGIVDPTTTPGGGGGGGGTGGGTVSPTADLQVNPGATLLLNSDTDQVDPTELYLYNPRAIQGQNFSPISNQVQLGPVSVTDDGSLGVYVNEDEQIVAIIGLNTSNPREVFVDEDNFWANVAISKDGQRLAAISNQEDTSIYVFDLNTSKGVQYLLYNPTTAQGNARAGGVVYADAIEWDYTGEYVMYDAFNQIGELDYWDINFLQAWDVAGNDFGSGEVLKLFSNLPEGISVGNPVFSKNSPYIIAFDVLDDADLVGDASDDEYFLYGSNIETGETVEMFQNLDLSFPNYAVDDKSLAFNAQNNDGDPVIAQMPLAADKITPSAAPTILIPQAQWPVWYATGKRSLNVSTRSELSKALKMNLYPNPTQQLVTLSYTLEKPAGVSVELYNVLGSKVKEFTKRARQGAGTHVAEVDLSAFPAGIYLVKVTVDDTSVGLKLVKQ